MDPAGAAVAGDCSDLRMPKAALVRGSVGESER